MDWLPSAASGAWLHWAAWLAAGLAGVTLVLMAQVLLLSEIAARQRLRRRAFERRWRPRLAAASLDSDAMPPPPARAELDWWLAAWCQMQQPLRGVAHDRLNALLLRFGLDRHAAALARSRDMEGQLLGLACLRHLAHPRHWDVAADLARAPNGIRALAAADTLVAIDPVAAMRLLVPLVARRQDWSHARVVQLARNAGQDAITGPLLAQIAQPLPPGIRDRLHALLPLADLGTTLPWARGVLAGQPDASERIAALDVLARAGDPRDKAQALAALESASPAVRGAGLRALRSLATAGDLPLLEPHLADRDWAVRQAAADAVASLPGVDRDAAIAIAGRVADAYGRDALHRAIAERHA